MKEIIVTLLKAVPNRNDGSKRKSKTTVICPLPASVQGEVFDANNDQDYLMDFKREIFSGFFKNLDGESCMNEKFHI